MLLDRQRVKFWQKWVFGFMALIMAAFLIMIPINRGMGCGGSSTTNQLDKEIVKYAAAVKADPKNAAAWSTLAENYFLRADQQPEGSAARKADLSAAAQHYERADKLLAKKKGAAAKQQRIDTLEQLALIYATLTDNQQLTNVYGRLTDLRPKNPDYFFYWGDAASKAGDINLALLAFSTFLRLDPTSPDASTVRAWIKQNTPKASPSPTKGAGQ